LEKKNIGSKAALKMLMKLTTGHERRWSYKTPTLQIPTSRFTGEKSYKQLEKVLKKISS
jgi:hypothetical protein